MPEIILTYLPAFLNVLFLFLSVSYISQAFSKGREKLLPSLISILSGLVLSGIAFLLFEKGIFRLIFIATALFLFTFPQKMRLHIRFLLIAAVYAIVSAADFISLLIICSLFSLPLEATLVEPIYTLGIIALFFIAFTALFIIKHTLRFISSGNFDKRFLLIYILPISTVIIIFIEYAIFCNLETSSTLNLFMLLGSMLLLVTNFIIFSLTDALFTKIETEKRLQTASVLIEKQKEEYSKLLDADNEIKRYRHDVKNFLSGILFNLENENYDAVKESVSSKLHSFNFFNKYASAQNPLNALLSFKADNTSNAELLWDLNIKGSYSFDDIELAVLLGNLVDNAIEATEKLPENSEKKINVNLSYKDGIMVITVTNPVKEKVDVLNLSTTKKNKKEHGLGLISVKSIAEKYKGNVAFTCKDLVFVASVILHEKE